MIKRILILDDDPGVLEVIDLALTYSGFQVRPLLVSENIFQMVNDFEPHLIIIDYILRGTNGGEVCRQLKNDPSTKQIPIIMLSAYVELDQAIDDSYGHTVFISKPFDLSYLLSKINECTQSLPPVI